MDDDLVTLDDLVMKQTVMEALQDAALLAIDRRDTAQKDFEDALLRHLHLGGAWRGQAQWYLRGVVITVRNSGAGFTFEYERVTNLEG